MTDAIRRFEVKDHTKEGTHAKDFSRTNTRQEKLPSYAEKSIRKAGGVPDHIKITSLGEGKINLYDTKNEVEASLDLKKMKQSDPALYKAVEYNIRKEAIIESIADFRGIQDIQSLNDLQNIQNVKKFNGVYSYEYDHGDGYKEHKLSPEDISDENLKQQWKDHIQKTEKTISNLGFEIKEQIWSDSLGKAVLKNAGEKATPGDKKMVEEGMVYSYDSSSEKWSILRKDGKMEEFTLDHGKVLDDTELTAVKEYATMPDGRKLLKVEFDENDNTKYKVKTAETPDGQWEDLEKKDIHSDILAKINDEKEIKDPEHINAARIIMGVKDWDDVLKDKELAFEKARSIRRWGLRFASVLEQANMAGAVESQSIEGAIDSLMQMSSNPNQNQPMTIEATHRLMKAAKHHYEDWKKFQRAGHKIIERYGPELAEKHGITKEGLETLDKDITRKFEQLVKKYPDAKIE
jgi:hypothetical protein